LPPPHWTHNREYFYKYVSAETAKIVLQSNTLRWSSPTLFNDPFDVQFDLHIDYDRDRVANRAMQALVDGYLGRAPINPGNVLGKLLQFIRDKAPGISEAELREKLFPGFYEGMERAERLIPRSHEEFRAVVADLKLLCLAEARDNILMWSHYGKNHTGVVLELRCIERLDSAWGAARPVRYETTMPLLIDEDKLVALLSGVGNLAEDQIFENSVFVKATDWAYEREWRLVGGRDKTRTTEDFGFHPDEVSGIYLGCRINPVDGERIIRIAGEKYPHATIYIGRKSERRFAVEFAPLRSS
jgi:Protein of unknown function (DUF2971)